MGAERGWEGRRRLGSWLFHVLSAWRAGSSSSLKWALPSPVYRPPAWGAGLPAKSLCAPKGGDVAVGSKDSSSPSKGEGK